MATTKKRTHDFSTYIPMDLYEELKLFVREKGLKISFVTAQAIREYITDERAAK